MLSSHESTPQFPDSLNAPRSSHPSTYASNNNPSGGPSSGYSNGNPSGYTSNNPNSGTSNPENNPSGGGRVTLSTPNGSKEYDASNQTQLIENYLNDLNPQDRIMFINKMLESNDLNINAEILGYEHFLWCR